MPIERGLIVSTVIPAGLKEFPAAGSRTYRGLSTASDTGSFALYDIALIKQDLVNHFHIRQGEKLENPMFGTVIWDLLFEPLTEDVKTLILENVTEIINYDPRLEVGDIIVSEYESGLQIECELTYLPYNISEQLRFTFDQDNGILS